MALGKGYLQRDVRVQLKGRHFICPRQEFLCFGVNVVVEDGPLRGQLDRFKFIDPPLAELHSVVNELKGQEGKEEPEGSAKGAAGCPGAGRRLPRAPVTWSWNMAPPKAQKQANTK